MSDTTINSRNHLTAAYQRLAAAATAAADTYADPEASRAEMRHAHLVVGNLAEVIREGARVLNASQDGDHIRQWRTEHV